MCVLRPHSSVCVLRTCSSVCVYLLLRSDVFVLMAVRLSLRNELSDNPHIPADPTNSCR